MNAGAISVGGIVGLFAHSVSPCRGVQVSLLGGVFSEFNLDAPSRDLINTDFIVGAQVSIRTRGVSGRIRVYHQSSHLGEDLILHNLPGGDVNFGFDAIDGLVSIDRTWWRAYAGGGYLGFLNDGSGSGILHAGAELRARRLLRGFFRPVAGLDVTTLQARSWGVTTAASGGLEWTSPAATRRMRVLLLFRHGFTPFGEFAVLQRSRAFGLQFQIEF